jgi:hypothetical protein
MIGHQARPELVVLAAEKRFKNRKRKLPMGLVLKNHIGKEIVSLVATYRF